METFVLSNKTSERAIIKKEPISLVFSRPVGFMTLSSHNICYGAIFGSGYDSECKACVAVGNVTSMFCIFNFGGV